MWITVFIGYKIKPSLHYLFFRRGLHVELTPWKRCLQQLEGELTAQQFNTWIRPLHVIENNDAVHLLAPNRFVQNWISEQYLSRIEELLSNKNADRGKLLVKLGVGSRSTKIESQASASKDPRFFKNSVKKKTVNNTSNLNNSFTFESFVEGKSNQLAKAASVQVAQNPGGSYNPLFIYGGVGLGKTHLMQAIGAHILKNDSSANVAYLHSERFVADMVSALQHNEIDKFKKYYRSLSALLIDDIQFFAKKERSQEEFFHTFNALLEGQNQIILTCDRYPKEVNGLEERLKSRFGWGLTVAIEPPELETRVAIARKKASLANVELADDVSFFIAKRFRSNVRELEGALNRVIANANLTGQDITLDFTKSSLRDLLKIQDKQVTIENIQKITAEYYKIRVADLLSKRRSRSVTRPRQMAMTITKELTNHSLPEIGDAFGGRDHTTVIHAYRKIKELREVEIRIEEDYVNLINTLTS